MDIRELSKSTHTIHRLKLKSPGGVLCGRVGNLTCYITSQGQRDGDTKHLKLGPASIETRGSGKTVGTKL